MKVNFEVKEIKKRMFLTEATEFTERREKNTEKGES